MVNRASSSFPTLAALWPALSRFFHWWRQELASFVPTRMRLWWRETGRLILVSIEDTRMVFRRPVGDRLEELFATTLDADRSKLPADEINQRLRKVAGNNFRLMLCLPKDRILLRPIKLPLAVEENLRQTLTFELDRHTPFRPEHAYFDCRVSDRNTDKKQLSVDLAAVPRQVVDQTLARTTAMGLRIAGAVLADDVLAYGNDCRNLLPTASRQTSKASGRLWWRTGLGIASLLLLIALLVIPLWQKRSAAISLLTPLAEVKTAAQQTDALRDRLTKLTDEYNFLPGRKWHGQSSLRVLEELSKRLPDDTYLIQFEFDGKGVQLQGESGSAAGLVETLEASPLFKEVGFKAQLTKIQGTSNDRFHIAAALKPVEKAKQATEPPVVAPAAPAKPDKSAP